MALQALSRRLPKEGLPLFMQKRISTILGDLNVLKHSKVIHSHACYVHGSNLH